MLRKQLLGVLDKTILKYLHFLTENVQSRYGKANTFLHARQVSGCNPGKIASTRQITAELTGYFFINLFIDAILVP